MAGQPDPGKIEALEAEIAEVKAENHSLHEQLSARDQRNAALARPADELRARVTELDGRERGRADQAASATVRDLASTAGLCGRDDGSLPQNVIEAFRTLAQSGVEAAADSKLPDLMNACRWLERALDEGHPPSDTIHAALEVAFRWGEQLAVISAPKPILRDAEGKPTHVVSVTIRNQRGPTDKVSLSVLARLERMYSGDALAAEVRRVCDVSDSTAYRALARWRRIKKSGIKFVIDIEVRDDADGRSVPVLVSIPDEPLPDDSKPWPGGQDL
jgi:hypothetical protein